MYHQRQAALHNGSLTLLRRLSLLLAVLVITAGFVPGVSAAPPSPEAEAPTPPPDRPEPADELMPAATVRMFIPLVGDPPPAPTPRPGPSPRPSTVPSPGPSPRPSTPPAPTAPAPTAPSPNAGSVLQPYFFDKPRDGMSTATVANTVSWVSVTRGNTLASRSGVLLATTA